MRILLKIMFFACLLLSGVFREAAAQQQLLRYDQPASDWMNEALPIGNGYMGAMFFGGTLSDEIQISEESFWAGGPRSHKEYNGGNRQGSWKYLEEIRSLLKSGDKKQAAALAGKYFTGVTHRTEAGDQFGDFGGSQTFGSLRVNVETSDSSYTDYTRTLDLENALGEVRYRMGGTEFNNSYFASYPARLIVARYSNTAPNGMEYTIGFDTPHPGTLFRAEKKQLLISGKLASNGLPFEARILVKTDGKAEMKKGEYRISRANSIELYISVSTAYRNEYPLYTGNDYKVVNRTGMERAAHGSFESLKKEHTADYRALFDRVRLDLGKTDAEQLTTDERQLRYSRGGSDPGLEALYFQYGRYLLISSSRPGTLPAHLQGRWNRELNAPWACDYHMNINLQMNYWPAEVTNLSECHLPLIDYVDKLREPGRITAREYFNARGWSVHTMNNAYGFTAPGWSFYWGYAPNSAAWLCRHLWEHYLFTRDSNYLIDKAWPVMKEAGEFWLDYLTEDSDGTLVSSPSYSPEHGDIAVGAAIDQEVAWDLFTALIEASAVVTGEERFIDTVRQARERLSPLKIGRFGQLQEWKEDLDDPRNEHRHVSHLYALFPGDQITLQKTPKLAGAARKSLLFRGEGGTGWSLAWKINFWARLQDGDQSYKMLRNLLRPSVSKGDYKNLSGSGSYTNLLCAHPPFQIDGNLGAVSGIAELLLQSHAGTVELLPALPAAWPSGSVEGLKARGGYTIGMNWKDGLLQSATVKAEHSGDCIISYKGKEQLVNLKAGETTHLQF